MSKEKNKTETPTPTPQPPKKSVLQKLRDSFKEKVSKESYSALLARHNQIAAEKKNLKAEHNQLLADATGLKAENENLKNTLKEIEDLIDAEAEKSDE